jgi:hypothetical protein
VVGLVAGVTGGADDDDAMADGGLGHAGEVVGEVGGLVVAAAGDVEDADVVAHHVGEGPLDAEGDVVVADAREATDLEEDDLALAGEALVAPAREVAVAGADDAGHHAVPGVRVGGHQVLDAVLAVEDVEVLADPGPRGHEVRVSEEARVQEGDGDAAARVALFQTDALGHRQDAILRCLGNFSSFAHDPVAVPRARRSGQNPGGLRRLGTVGHRFVIEMPPS